MSRQLEQVQEERRVKQADALVKAVEYGLEGAVQHSGGMLLGFSARLDQGDCLLILRAIFAGERQVAFVGSGNLADALRKAVRDGRRDQLVWKPDKFAK